MFYHVSILTKLQASKDKSPIVKVDMLSLSQILQDIIIPYVNEEEFIFEGIPITKNDIVELIVKESNISAKDWAEQQQNKLSLDIPWLCSPQDIIRHSNFPIITSDLVKKVKNQIATEESNSFSNGSMITQLNKKKVFIVHGHDLAMKHELARFIESIGLYAIIIDECVNKGQTIIEKIESNSDVGYAIILYSPCDIGGINKENLQPRARQNVVFEHGYMIGHLGRDKVCAIMKGEIEKPTDIDGIVYISMTDNWKILLGIELKNAGIEIDLNLLVHTK